MSQPVSTMSPRAKAALRSTSDQIEDFLPELSRSNLDISQMEGEDFVTPDRPTMAHGQEGIEPHQPDEDEQDEEEVSFVYTEAEKDAMHALERSKAGKGVKRPRGSAPIFEEDDDEVPNLSEIFDNYDTPHPIRISICRAYASYLASMQPKKPRAPRKY